MNMAFKEMSETLKCMKCHILLYTLYNAHFATIKYVRVISSIKKCYFTR